jgi:hypothetical protein
MEKSPLAFMIATQPLVPRRILSAPGDLPTAAQSLSEKIPHASNKRFLAKSLGRNSRHQKYQHGVCLGTQLALIQ